MIIIEMASVGILPAFIGAMLEVVESIGWIKYIESISNIAGNVFTAFTSIIVIFLTVIIARANRDTNKREEQARIDRVKEERAEKLLSLSNYLIQNKDLFESIQYPISDKGVLYRCVVYFDFASSHNSKPNKLIQYSFAKVENIANSNSRLSFRFIGHSQVEPESIEIVEEPEFDLDSPTWDNLFQALRSALNYRLREKLPFKYVKIRERRVDEISLETRFTGKKRGHAFMNTKEDQKIVDAILNINANRVKDRIKKASHIDARDSNGRTFLHYAVSIAYIQLQNYYDRALIKDPQGSDSSRYLHKLMKDLEKIIKTLIKEGANENARDNRGEPVIYAAASAGNLRAVNILIKGKARVNVTSKRGGSTALHAAVNSGSKEIVEALVTSDCDLNYKNSVQKTPLHFASELDKLNMLEDEKEQTALAEVLVRNQLEIAKILIEKGAKIDETDQVGATPLHYAVRLNQSSMAKMLTRNQSRISDILGTNQLKIAKSLIEKGADVNKRSSEGLTPLHYAIYLDSPNILKVLIEYNSSAEERLKQLEVITVLAKSQLSLAEVLIDGNAKVNERDEKGKTPLHYVFQLNQSGIIKVLIESRSAAVGKLDLLKFMEIMVENQLSMAKILIENGANVNEKDEKERTPLHYASQLDQMSIMDMLADSQSGAEGKLDPSSVIKALAESRSKMISMLIEQGAEVNERDENEETPLHKVSYIGYFPAIKTLMDSNAEVNGTNSSGKTPLQITLCNTDPYDALQIIDLYVEKGACISFGDRLSLFVPRGVRALRTLFHRSL